MFVCCGLHTYNITASKSIICYTNTHIKNMIIIKPYGRLITWPGRQLNIAQDICAIVYLP